MRLLFRKTSYYLARHTAGSIATTGIDIVERMLFRLVSLLQSTSTYLCSPHLHTICRCCIYVGIYEVFPWPNLRELLVYTSLSAKARFPVSAILVAF